MSHINRIKKSLSQTKDTVFDMESRVQVMLTKKEEREAYGQEYFDKVLSLKTKVDP